MKELIYFNNELEAIDKLTNFIYDYKIKVLKKSEEQANKMIYSILYDIVGTLKEDIDLHSVMTAYQHDNNLINALIYSLDYCYKGDIMKELKDTKIYYNDLLVSFTTSDDQRYLYKVSIDRLD